MNSKIKISDFDDVFPYIGGFGPFQFIIFIVLCVVNCYFSFVYYGQIFMTLSPPHWCSSNANLSEEIWNHFGQNLTAEELKELTIPRKDNGLEYAQCIRYDVTVDQVEVVDGKLMPNISWPTIECTFGWDYNYTLYYPTITSQLNWVCQDDWKVPSAQAVFFVGCMIGTLVFGWLADAFGRIPVAMATNLLAGIFGIVSSFSSSFIIFCVMRFIVGMAFDSNFTIIYILGLEFVSTNYRTIIANVPFIVFLTASMCAMPWIAYAAADWTIFGVIIHAPLLLAIFLPWVAPESVRWLLSKGKHEKAISIVKRAAKINSKELSSEFVETFEKYALDLAQQANESVTWYDLLKTPNLRKRFLALSFIWIAIFLAYDGHVRHTEHLGTNIFMSFTFMGSVELPGDLIAMFGMEYVGRKHALVWSIFMCGVVTIAIIAVPQSSLLTLLTLAVAGRFLITIAMNVGMQYIVEILPTVGRAQGNSLIHTLGLGMAFVSPYISYSGKIHFWVPYFTYGIICIFGALVGLMLPETIGEKLPDSLNEGEEYFTNQPVFYNPCKRGRAMETSEE